MKKTLRLLSLAALTIGLLGSCSKIDERISNLEKRVDGIESTSIASVQQQIDGIKASITKLEAADVTIGGKIDELKATAEAHQTLIDALKEADKALGQKDTELEARIATLEGQVATINGQIKTLEDADKAINDRIDELKTYVDTEIGKTKDWAEETFATLEQYQQTADDLAALSVTVSGISTTLAGVQTSIAGLDTKINGIDADLQGKITAAKTELEGKITSLKTELEGKIATAISASETSIKSWINELLKGYYTAAQVDARIGSLNTAIEAAKGTAKTRIDSVATELTKLKTAVDTAKAAIRTEYKNAIDESINKLNGEIRGALLDSIAAVNGRIEALDTRVTTLEGRMTAVEGNVGKLLAMIQSVTILPAYTDGSVEAVGNTLTIDFVVSPAAAVKGVTKDRIKVLVHQAKVQTKANESYTKIDVKSATVNESTGDVTITADISGITPAEGKALTVAVNIKNGISDFTTEFVPVTVAPAPLPAGALKGEFTVAEGKKVRFSKGNLTYNVSTTTWAFYEHQYDCATGYDSNLISLFTWGYGTWSTSPNGTGYQTGDFTDWGSKIGDDNTWRSLTTAEWQYLFNYGDYTSDVRNGKYKWATVNGVGGYVIAPDDFTGTLQESYANDAGLADAGNLVFLPAAARRSGSTVSFVGERGYYWSSTASNASSAYFVSLNSGSVSPAGLGNRTYGCSVRLITEVK